MQNDDLNLEAGDNPALRVKMGETGWIGLRQFEGIILEEMRKDLQFPRSNRTYQEMGEDATIASALSYFSMLVSKADWRILPPDNPTEDDLKKVKFLEQCMHDMDHSWYSFIKEITSMFTYGYGIQEKVFRRRRKSNGSKYDDGLVGIAKMPTRSQTTIYRWLFDDFGRNLTGVIQDTSFLMDGYRLANNNPYGGQIQIDRNKFLLFRTDVSRDNPQGRSSLSKVYKAWRYRKQIEESEAVGITRGLGGIPRFDIPADYLKADATPDQVSTVEAFKNIGRNLQNNEQACIIMPKFYDDQGNSLFDFELIGPPNASQYDTNQAIVRWDSKILQALFADVLQMGNSKSGNLNLADNKSSIAHMAVECYLKEIQDPLNNDLIPQLFALNGWDLDRLPTFEFSQIQQDDLDVLSKFIQRVASVGLITVSPENINKIAEWAGLPTKHPTDMPIEDLREMLTGYESGASEGMEKGSGNGTADSAAGSDNSTSNNENT